MSWARWTELSCEWVRRFVMCTRGAVLMEYALAGLFLIVFLVIGMRFGDYRGANVPDSFVHILGWFRRIIYAVSLPVP